MTFFGLSNCIQILIVCTSFYAICANVATESKINSLFKNRVENWNVTEPLTLSQSLYYKSHAEEYPYREHLQSFVIYSQCMVYTAPILLLAASTITSWVYETILMYVLSSQLMTICQRTYKAMLKIFTCYLMWTQVTALVILHWVITLPIVIQL